MVAQILTLPWFSIFKPIELKFRAMARRVSASVVARVWSWRLCASRAAAFSAAPSGRSGERRPKTPASPASRSPSLTRSSPRPKSTGPGICGMTRPLKVSALDNGAVAVDKILTIDCPMIPALEAWLDAIVEPDAQTRFGQRVATVKVFGAYSCRGNRQHGRRAPFRARLRQRGRRRGLHPRRRANDRLRPRLEERRTRRKRPSCTRPTPAPANISPPFSGPARTCSTTTTSISISPTMGGPTPARGASASRRPRLTFCRRPRPPTVCRPRRISRSRSTSRT